VPLPTPGLPVPTQAAPPPLAPPGVSPACSASWGAETTSTALRVPVAPAGTDLCGIGAVRPAPPAYDCTKRVDAGALPGVIAAAVPGDRVCVTGTLPNRLVVSRSGVPGNPIQVIGYGQASVKGVTVSGNDVVIRNLDIVGAKAPGIQITGRDITVVNNTVRSPRGGDGDGIRFFGANLRILHNTVSDVRNLHKAHADCMQTFATGADSPPSRDVRIDSNRCEQIDNQCLIAEGPDSSAGDGSGKGQTSDILFTHNYCQTGASQAVMIDDVQNVVVTDNQIAGHNEKAFAFANKSTGARVSGNQVANTIGYVVGMDQTSRLGYQGPAVGGKPFFGGRLRLGAGGR
jgi:hypothetical protein